MHAAAAIPASVKSAATATEPATSATARIGVIRDQGYGDQNECGQSRENTRNIVRSSLWTIL